MEKQKKRKSIRGRVIVSIIISGFLAIGGAAGIVVWTGTDQLMEAIGLQFEGLAKANSHAADTMILNEISDLRHYGDSVEIQKALLTANQRFKGLSDPEIEALLEHEEGLWESEKQEGEISMGILLSEASQVLLRTLSKEKEELVYAGLIIADQRGALLASINKSPVYRHAHEPWWQNLSHRNKAAAYIGDLYKAKNQVILMDIAAPVTGHNNDEIIGTIKVTLFVKQFFTPFIGHVEFGKKKTGHAMLIDSNGAVIICPILPTGSHITDSDLLTPITASYTGWVSVENDAHGGESFLNVFYPIVGFGPVEEITQITAASGGPRWHSFIRQHPSEIYAPIKELLVWLAFSGVFGIVTLGISGNYASQRVVAPIIQLKNVVDLMKMGKQPPTLVIDTNDEVQDLSESFISMEQKLQEAFATLENKVEEKTRLLIEVQKRNIAMEKFASVGQVSAFIAHEMRSPLGVIQNAIYYLKSKLSKIPELNDSKIMKHATIIENEVTVSSKIIDGLLSLSKRVSLTLLPIDLEAKITDALASIPIPPRIEVVREQEPNLPHINADADQIQRVFVNLIRNAEEAMRAGGELKIVTRADGKKLIVEISDTGVGIDERMLPMLFEPFSTTKSYGIGLGLSIVKKIISEHKGKIEVNSTVGAGTTFTVTLPL